MTDTRRPESVAKVVLTKFGAKSPSTLLKEAEAKAKASRVAEDPGSKPFQFAVNYRLDKTSPSPKGDYTKRYNALIELVHALDWTPWHYATSSWEIHSHQRSAKILAALSAPLDEKIDVLTVTPIGVSRVFGDRGTLEN